MKIAKSRIHLSPDHPSLLLELPEEAGTFAPVVMDPGGVLVDGYRRFQIQPGPEIDAVCVESTNVFEAALSMNRRSRAWDDLDCFLWARWARSLDVEPALQITRFPPELHNADIPVLRLLAARSLTLRQAALILHSPLPYRPFFQDFLGKSIRINNNETADFIHMSVDLKKLLKLNTIQEVVERVEGSTPDLDTRRRGERLLKGMRVLRYPYYQEKSDEFVSCWRELDLGRNIQVDRAHFLERGRLEITVTSTSYHEMKDSLAKLAQSLESPLWRKIWKE